MSISTGLKNILQSSQASNLHGNSPAGYVLGDILAESWSCLTKKNPTNVFDYFVIERGLILEEDEVGRAFCQRVIYVFCYRR